MTEKLFGRDIGMRSTFLKYDPCVTDERNTVACDNCMVSLISDRFLGDTFARTVLSKKYRKTKNLFTYVLIADTVGCNLNCWFCYAWRLLNMKSAKKIHTYFLSAKELAKQFNCKIRKTADLAYLRKQINNKFPKGKKKADDIEKYRKGITKHIDMELPFSRIRISGGEPIYSNADVFHSSDESQDLLIQTLKYWIDFFEALDEIIGRIKEEKLINIAMADSPWHVLEYPVWLTEANDRIMVRFDTNGIIFGKAAYANLFYSELLRLFEENKLNNLNIQIDYSFKGVGYKEFMWSQRKRLPAIAKNNDKEVTLEEHPQVQGYRNIISNMRKFTKKNPDFKDCVSITLEKGIDHYPERKLWLYYPDALKWQKLAGKLNFEFSDVVNYFDLNFGWYVDAKIRRYSNRGAVIELSTRTKTIDQTSASIDYLKNFRRKNFVASDYATRVYPVYGRVEIAEKAPEAQQEISHIHPLEQNFWVITGSEENMRVGIQHGLWGVKKTLDSLWKALKKDDILFFYCTKPISGVVGYGKVTNVQIDTQPFWPNENPNKESKYPLRIEFEVKKVFKNWNKTKKTLSRTGIDFYHGLNYVELDKREILTTKLGMESCPDIKV